MTSPRSSGSSSVPLPGEVNTVGEALTWLASTAALYRSLGEAYGTSAYTVAADTLTTTIRRVDTRNITATARLRDVLTAVTGQVRAHAAIADRFGEDATAFGLDLAALDIAGLSAALRPVPGAQGVERRAVAPETGRSL